MGPGEERFSKNHRSPRPPRGRKKCDATLPTAVRICLTFSWFLIKQPNIKHITQKQAGELWWPSAPPPCKGRPEQVHQAPRMARWGPPPWGRAPSPALCLPRQPVLTHLPFVPPLSQLLSSQCLALAGSRWPKPGSYLAGLHLRAPVLPQSSHPELLPRCHGPSAQGISGVSSSSSALPPALLNSLPAAPRLFFESGGGGLVHSALLFQPKS